MSEPNTTKRNGLFKPGNKAAAGHSSKSQKLRAGILASISQTDIKAITAKLIEQAKAGDQGAAKLLLQFIGKPVESPMVAIQNNVIQQKTPEESRVSAMELIRKIQARREAGLTITQGRLSPESQAIADRFAAARAAQEDVESSAEAG